MFHNCKNLLKSESKIYDLNTPYTPLFLKGILNHTKKKFTFIIKLIDAIRLERLFLGLLSKPIKENAMASISTLNRKKTIKPRPHFSNIFLLCAFKFQFIQLILIE